MPFSAKVTLWDFPRDLTATKSFSVGEDGRLKKDGLGFFPDGRGWVVQATLADIAAEHLNGEKSPRVIIYSVPRGVRPKQVFVIASENNAAKAGYVAEKIFKNIGADARVITRNRENFARLHGEAGYLLLDVDGFPEEISSLLEKLALAWPEIVTAPMLCAPSSSGFVCLAGEIPKPSGWHILVGIADAADTERALSVLHDRLWLVHGAHKIVVTEAGHASEKTLVDRAMKNAIQPHFFQRPHKIGQGVIRQAPLPAIRNPDAEGVDTRTSLPDLSPQESALVLAAKASALADAKPEIDLKRAEIEEAQIAKEIKATGADYRAAQRAVRDRREAEEAGILDPVSTELHFDLFGWVTCAELAANRDRYHEQTLADPLEPFYHSKDGKPARNIAKCFLSPDRSQFRIATFAHSNNGAVKYVLNIAGGADFSALLSDVEMEDAAGPRLSERSVLELFTGVDVIGETYDGADIATAFISADGLCEFDQSAAKLVRLSQDGRSLFRIAGGALAHCEDEGPAIIRSLVRTGNAAKVIICGNGAAAVSEAINAATTGIEGVKSRVDFYGGWPPIEAHKLIPRADKCQKPKALEAVRKFAPRSIGAVLCAKSNVDKCEFFDTCEFILNRVEAAASDIVHAAAAVAGTDLNNLIGETAGPIGVFMDPAATISIKAIPAADLFRLGGVFKDVAAACIANQLDTSGAIRAVKVDGGVMKDLEAQAKAHGIGAGPSDTQEDVVRAVHLADAQKRTSLPAHEIAFAVLNALGGNATIDVHDASVGEFILTFSIYQGLLRAAHHHASVAIVDTPIEVCRPDKIGMQLFGEPAISVRGGCGVSSDVIQVFDSRRGQRMNIRPLLVALQTAGIKPVVVGKNLLADDLVPGVAGLHPDDDVPEDAGVIFWVDDLVASDFGILRRAAVAGLSLPTKMKFRLGTGFWVVGEKRYAYPVYRPTDDGACACWQVECWMGVERMMASSGGVPVVLLSNVPPVSRSIAGLVSTDDLTLSSVAEVVAFSVAIAGIDRLDAAELVWRSLSTKYDPDEILNLALMETEALPEEKLKFAEIIAKICRREAP